MPRTAFPSATTLVMAHPDDEVLWASSVLSHVERIVFCFGDVPSEPGWSEGRRLSVAEYPLRNVTQLGIAESEVFGSAAWPDPLETEYGLAVRRGPTSRRGFSEPRYRGNMDRLVNALRPALLETACVITHSPWGEYGHEEHVQVFRVVAKLQAEIGFELWVPGYVSNRSIPLMMRHMACLYAASEPLATDAALGARLQELYARNRCWTWFDDYSWPDHEYFHRWKGSGTTPGVSHAGTLIAMNVMWLDPQKPRRSSRSIVSRIFRRPQRLLRRSRD